MQLLRKKRFVLGEGGRVSGSWVGSHLQNARPINFKCIIPMMHCFAKLKFCSPQKKKPLETSIIMQCSAYCQLTCISIIWPCIWWTKKILIFNIYKMLSGSDCLDVRCLNAFIYYQILWTNKILQLQSRGTIRFCLHI